jgi:CRP-like cAMP-binding protein
MNFGELVLLGQRTRSALVHAESAVRCRMLGMDALNHLATELPELKIAILRNLSLDLADKLKHATQMISVLAN